MAELINAACAADGIDRFETADDVARMYAHLDNCDPDRDLVFAEIDGAVAAYGRVTWWEEIEGPYRYLPFCFVHPDRRGRGLGTAMLAHNEARLRLIARDHPADVERTFVTYCTDSETNAVALYEAAGYEPVMYEAEMVRADFAAIPAAPLPDGFDVRPPREDELRKVWEADAEAFRDHLAAAQPTENEYRLFRERPWTDPSLWRIAWDGDEVAGQVRSFINEDENRAFGRKRGYAEFISVRRPYRRRGLARALLVQSLHALAERGMEEAALGVLMENRHGALALYESVGFRVVRTWSMLHKPL